MSDNAWDRADAAIRQAKYEISASDRIIRDLMDMASSRLRASGVSVRALTRLKKELRDFNMHTGKWKD